MVFLKDVFIYLTAKTYVVGTQKNCLNEMVLLSTKDKSFKMFKLVGKKYSQIYP